MTAASDTAKRIQVATAAALTMRTQTEFALYCWALDECGSNDANARAVAAALVADHATIADVASGRVFLAGRGRS